MPRTALMRGNRMRVSAEPTYVEDLVISSSIHDQADRKEVSSSMSVSVFTDLRASRMPRNCRVTFPTMVASSSYLAALVRRLDRELVAAAHAPDRDESAAREGAGQGRVVIA